MRGAIGGDGLDQAFRRSIAIQADLTSANKTFVIRSFDKIVKRGVTRNAVNVVKTRGLRAAKSTICGSVRVEAGEEGCLAPRGELGMPSDDYFVIVALADACVDGSGGTGAEKVEVEPAIAVQSRIQSPIG